MNQFALYTTIYRGVESFLADWCRSINNQDFRDFDIWIGIDGVETKTVCRFLDGNFRITFIPAVEGDTPISLRCRAIGQMISNYNAIVFTDSDDVLEPTRVSAALHGLGSADVYGCALELVDIAGQALGIYFGLVEGETPDSILPYNNFLGLSNTAWRSEALGACISVPERCVAMDWLLATRAWGHDSRITFDTKVRMRYRQYEGNTACLLPPFSAEQIFKATKVVREHYRSLATEQERFSSEKRQLLKSAANRIETFSQGVLASPDRLSIYIDALNQLPPHRLWWLSVAHPALEDLWSC